MAGNTFGQLFRITTFGESHGPLIGVVIDGCPAGLEISDEFIQKELNRRKPSNAKHSTSRKEDDIFEIVSGIFDGKSTGAPICIVIKNKDQKPSDYDQLQKAYRPSHADYTYEVKYGIRDYRGGGRASARETAVRVAAAAIAKLLLKTMGIEVTAFTRQIGTVKLLKPYSSYNLKKAEDSLLKCPDVSKTKEMQQLIEKTREEGDTLGGVIECVVSGMIAGLGEPVFDKLNADLAKAMFSIQTVKGFETGAGFEAASMKGSQHNDLFETNDGFVATKTNFSAGIQGGISNGMDIYFRVAFKPVSTIMQKQATIDSERKEVTLEAKGRHDVCVVPRAVPIVEAMTALVLADHFLRSRTNKLDWR